MLMTPIETFYKGTKFRSRLEARYAYLFDLLNIKWEYEIEGFQMPNGEWYLPDFYLPEVYLRLVDKPGVFFEIKPSENKAEESKHIFEQFDKPLVVACGTPSMQSDYDLWLFEWWKERWDNFMYFKYCTKCRFYEIEFSESNYCICKKCKETALSHKDWSQYVSLMKSIRF